MLCGIIQTVINKQILQALSFKFDSRLNFLYVYFYYYLSINDFDLLSLLAVDCIALGAEVLSMNLEAGGTNPTISPVPLSFDPWLSSS